MCVNILTSDLNLLLYMFRMILKALLFIGYNI